MRFGTAGSRFSVLLSPGGGYVLQYQVTRTGLSIVEHIVLPGPVPNPVAAVERLWHDLGARLRGADIIVVLRGFGVLHELLTLPPGEPTPVRSIAAREMARIHGAGLFVDVLRPPVPSAQPVQQVVAAAPADVLTTLEQALHERGAARVQVTTVPRALERLVLELDDSEGPRAIVLPLADGPAIAYVHEGRLRYFLEPLAVSGEVPLDVPLLVEQVARGRLYLRQNFRGATVDRVLVGGGDDENALLESLNAQLGVQARPIGADMGGPGALAAFGGILERLSADGVDLLALTRTQPTRYDRVQPALRAGAIAVLVVAAVFALSGLLRARNEAAALSAVRDHVAERMPEIWSIQTALEQRAGYAQRLAALEAADIGHGKLDRVLQAVASSVNERVQLTSLKGTWQDNGWYVEVGGIASGTSGADAVGSLNAFYNRLPRELPAQDLALGSFDYMPADSGQRAVQLSFNVKFSALGESP